MWIFRALRHGAPVRARQRITLSIACAAALAVPIVAAACAKREPTASPLTGGAPSLEALADSAWAAVARGDAAAMTRLRLSEHEHNELVWPELPASDPAAGYPVDLAWENIETRDAAARRRLLARFEGAGHRLRGVECTGEQQFESFHVLTECALLIRDPATGAVSGFQLFKDVIVWSGTHKIFRYYFDGE